MAATFKQLGQAEPPTAATPVQLYSPAAQTEAVVLTIAIANTSGGNATATIYQHATANTRSTATTILEKVLATDDYIMLNVKILLNDSGGEIAVMSSVDAALTFTAWGVELT